MIAVIITFRKFNENRLERRAGTERSSRKRNTLYTNPIHAQPIYLTHIYCYSPFAQLRNFETL